MASSSNPALEAMVSAEKRARSLSKDALRELIALARPYAGLKEDFTFSADTELSSNAAILLLGLSNGIISAAEEETRVLLEDEDDDVTEEAVAFALLNADGVYAEETFDRHASRLMYLAEGWAAIGFAEGLSDAQIVNNTLSYGGSPSASELWRRAAENGRYQASCINDGDLVRGRGILKDPIAALALAASVLVSRGYWHGSVFSMRRKGVQYYRVVRGSNYPCPICEDLCAALHPVTETVLPAHPRCCCYAVPVSDSEL